MALQDYLMPGETITYEAPFKVKVGEEDYEFKITDKRLVLYRRSGLIFKSDNFIGENISNIQSMNYSETGMISKKGIVAVQTQSKTLAFSQSASNMKVIYQQLQGLGAGSR